MVCVFCAAKRELYQQDLEVNRAAKRKTYEDNSASILAQSSYYPSYRISREGIARDQVKVDGVSKWPLPKTVNIFRGSWDKWAPIGDL